MKCPNSWKPIENSRPIAKATIPRVGEKDPAQLQPPAMTPRACSRAHFSAASTSSTQVGCAEVRRVVEGTRDEVHDAPERQPTRHERGHGLLVGRVVERRATPPASRRRGQPDRREGLLVQRQELPGARRRPVQRGLPSGSRSGPAQRERDRQPHVRRAGLRDGRAVGEVDHRVDDRLRVHHDVDVGIGDVEQQVRLDQLEALVDQGRRVDRDDRPHVPGRVRERLLDRDVVELVGGRPRNGPPLAVSTSRRPRRGRRRAGTGPAPSARSRPARAARLRRGRHQRRRRRSATPCWPARRCARPRSADSVGPSPIEPVIPLRTTSAGRAASSSAARGPARGSPAASTRPWPSRASRRRRRRPAGGPARRWPGRRRPCGRRA